MARAKALTLDNPRHALKRTIEQLTHRKRTWEIWRDFCELSAISLANAVDLMSPARTQREARYHAIREQYEPEAFARFPFALACVVECLEAGYDDVLGGMFMELELGSHWHGQFFSPYSIAAMMGRMTFDPETMRDRAFITVQEPAAGAGAMIIGLADAMRAAEFNPQQQMHVTAVDVDSMCVCMCYVQLSLLHIPAVVVHGNSLSLDEWSHWYTPAHVMGLWSSKLRRRAADAPGHALKPEVKPELMSETKTPEVSHTEPTETRQDAPQLALF